MSKLSICLLTFNSARLLRECVTSLQKVADEIIVVDSGSDDGTIDILRQFGLWVRSRPYTTHGDQMNFAVGLASNDWVLCIDSDEILDPDTILRINELKAKLDDASVAYRITRHWLVLGREVRAIYPISSPDYPVRLFNRTRARFNDAPVDDKPVGHSRTVVVPGHVRHDTFYSLHELFNKLNQYTTRLALGKPLPPSLLRAVGSASAAFVKWYFLKGSWRDGRVGLVAGVYAGLYSFLKYFKPWVSKDVGKGKISLR